MEAKALTKTKFKFKPQDPIIWQGKKGHVIETWWDGQENRCHIHLSLKSHRGSWSVREDSLELDKTKASS